ncbi:MAG: heat-inducible transcription repressor HrcA [Deltaproteobacteria bacterium RBG_13_65_10]|nr:MAG: heat-inducible transcription repressor HrcA [Deltaproteobacteria bacterium RBG_13_65_10]
MLTLSERHKRVLQAVIHDYTLTVEPVGSRTISRKYLGLSPATVRHVMSDLDEMGLLSQPHTSAGRVPTDRAFRFYVDSMLELQHLGEREKQHIRSGFESALNEGHDIMKRTSHLLSAVCRQVGLVVAPRLEEIGLKHIELIRIGRRRVMVVIISDRALVHNRVVRSEEDVDQRDLDHMSRTLNKMLAGLTFRSVGMRIEEEMRSDKASLDRLLTRALRFGREAVSAPQETDLYVEDPTRIFDQPEFLDVERMKKLFRTLEEKSKLLKLLDAVLESEGVSVVMGSESALDEMSGCALIVSRYGTGPRAAGALGVIGPIRMNYGKVIPVVEYVARLVSEYLN